MYDPNNKTIVEIKHKNKVKSMLKWIYRLITWEQEEEPVSSIVATGEYDCLLWLHSKLRSLHSNYTKNANSYGEAKQNLS